MKRNEKKWKEKENYDGSENSYFFEANQAYKYINKQTQTNTHTNK